MLVHVDRVKPDLIEVHGFETCLLMLQMNYTGAEFYLDVSWLGPRLASGQACIRPDRIDVQNKRYNALLDKWEEQAKRQDAILTAQEKQLKIKKILTMGRT